MASTDDKKDEPVAAAASATGGAAAAGTAAHAEVPDPDEDDLDDLDDVLDQFSAPGASGPGRPGALSQPVAHSTNAATAASAPEPPEADADVFAAQLQKEMAALMGEIDSSPDMQRQLDAMMAELSTGVPPKESKEAQKAAADVVQEAAGDATFQETIRRTMERMQASGDQASAAAAEASGGEADMLEALLKEMASAGGEGGDEDFSKMLLGMMEQLTNKEILYEPMKDLYDKFPKWLEDNRDKVDRKDLERYEEQQRLVKEIVNRFERDGYSDENTKDREFIVERMQKMQAAGSPPSDLVGDMKETQEALGDMDTGCPQQ